LCEENEYLSIAQTRNRARSITIGTAFGGVVEINMRSDVASVYSQMQPTEAIELMEQIAAGVGIEISYRPKTNFASWRGWEEVIGQKVSLDSIAWKGAAAWQLRLEGEEEEPKQIEGSKEDSEESENSDSRIKPTRSVNKKKKIKKDE
jgi:hypothetical protein